MTEQIDKAKQQLNIVMIGHVDHGKSTLIGRLIYEMGALPDGKYEQIVKSCKNRAVNFEWAYLMDALQSERAQNITIDITQFWLRNNNRDYVLIDAPGHYEFLRNMFTGAAESDAAILLIDAAQGMQEQTRKHAYLLQLLGITKIIIAINKMDKISYNEHKFNNLKQDITQYLKQLEIEPLNIVPISAYHGDMLKNRGHNMNWYSGLTLLQALEAIKKTEENYNNNALRFAVQDIYRFDREERIIAGTVLSGHIQKNDDILISPHNYQAKIKDIFDINNQKVNQAYSGDAIGITLTQQRFVERGHIISHQHNPPILSNQFYMRLFWLGKESLQKNKIYKIRIHNSSLLAEIKQINYALDTDNLTQQTTAMIEQNMVAEVIWQLRGLAAFDEYQHIAAMGRAVVLNSDDRIVAGGLLEMRNLPNMRFNPKKVISENVTVQNLDISVDKRKILNGHQGGILWFTGLSGAGKTTLATELQHHLFTKGYQVYVLDGDNIRHGLNSDLGFSPNDRQENIRRIGEVAALFANAGMIVITAFISPYAQDRRKARAAASEIFHTVHLQAEIDICEKRDVKGLYKKARQGKIDDFTGISAPYEIPVNPELTLDTGTNSVDECLDTLVKYVEKHFGKI